MNQASLYGVCVLYCVKTFIYVRRCVVTLIVLVRTRAQFLIVTSACVCLVAESSSRTFCGRRLGRWRLRPWTKTRSVADDQTNVEAGFETVFQNKIVLIFGSYDRKLSPKTFCCIAMRLLSCTCTCTFRVSSFVMKCQFATRPCSC